MSSFRLLKYVWPYRGRVAAMLSLMVIGIVLDVLRPWPMKLLVDQVLGAHPTPPRVAAVVAALPGSHGPEGLLLWVCVGTVLLFICSTLISTANSIASVGLGQRMTYHLSGDLFLHLQRLSLLFHSRRSVGDNMTRITGDAYCVQTLVTGTILPLLQAGLTLVTMFLIMWRLEPTMTLLSLTVVPFLLLILRTFRKPLKSRARARREVEGRMVSLVQQSLNAIPAVQAFTREEMEHERYRRCADEAVAAYLRGTLSQSLFKLSGGLVTAVGTAGIMWMGATYALHGRITVGTILVFLSYLGSLYGPLNGIISTFATLHSTSANADRVLEILDAEPEVKDAPDAADQNLSGGLSFENVTFGYEEDRPALKGVSFHVPPDSAVAVVGPTGAGKSTLAGLVMRFFDPWSGRILVGGMDIRDLKIRSLRSQVAMVLQEPFIFPLTIGENIAYGRPSATREEIVAAAVAASADGFIRRLPQGYDTVVGERGATLSGGEKQRLAIARAFLKDAPVLILDEPTSALDARTEAHLLEALDRLMKGRTTLIIAHRLSTIRNASLILVIEEGELKEQGTHAELMDRDGLYAALYSTQMEVARAAPVTGEHAVTREPEMEEALRG